MRPEKSRERLHTGPSQSNRVKRPFRVLHLSEVPTCGCNGPMFLSIYIPADLWNTGARHRARGVKADLSSSSDQTTTVRAFSFLRQPGRPNTPRPVAERERAAGGGQLDRYDVYRETLIGSGARVPLYVSWCEAEADEGRLL
jgi:hypothetical protein